MFHWNWFPLANDKRFRLPVSPLTNDPCALRKFKSFEAKHLLRQGLQGHIGDLSPKRFGRSVGTIVEIVLLNFGRQPDIAILVCVYASPIRELPARFIVA